jgi:hypothetical protein
MSESEPTTPSGKSKEQLLQDTQEHFSEKRQKQEEALSEIAQGENLEKYETIFLGDLEMDVRAWVPGNAMSQIQKAQNIAEEEDASRMMESMETMINALAEVAVSETYDTAFWRTYFERYGPEGMLVAVEKVLGPAIDSMEDRAPVENMEGKKDAANGFRTDADGNRVRSGR